MTRIPRSRPNRVTPFGEIEATPFRGSLMGNRGDLHAEDGTLRLKWRLRRWICCVTDEIAGRVTFDQPGLYTPLFFSDEAVALAAGHRPCGWCRAAALDRFKSCWRSAHRVSPSAYVTARAMDQRIHAARIDRKGRQIAHAARLADLPEGVFLTLPEATPRPLLLWRGSLHPWSHAGYEPPIDALRDATVSVLTPAPIVAVLKAGYRPHVNLATTTTTLRHRQDTEYQHPQLTLPFSDGWPHDDARRTIQPDNADIEP